ncbi:SpoIIE family protein phosphatase [Modestobacter sp. VKM Ac-2978]|uniref:SpoIIE family protein phosphatase n=1 Tax=Modestobacter sp. VKM Ac-2978 TaxID=3004132 RepID=UPI0022AB04FF|nr:SpoIIE family protein phosphatase [Modestobacter sp. VKM Ac-2978]MCZ2849593.1 SpoIIE family protein phosphatase [Modestobacter sp. VKM Ac-2978]
MPHPVTAAESAGARARVAAVRATELLDAAAEESFDRLTALARRLTGAPVALLTVVDDQRSYWLSRQGTEPGGPVQSTVEESFCQYVLGGEPLVLDDVTADERTKRNPHVEELGVRAWAGFPVHTPDGEVLGSFCVVDTVAHEWTTHDIELLEDLAAIASREVALRVTMLRAEQARAEARAEADRAALLARIGDLLTAGLEPAGVWQAIARLAVPALGALAYVCTVERDGSLAPVAVRHADPDQLAVLEEWVHGMGRRIGEASGPGHVAVTGRVQLIDVPADAALTPDQRDAAARLGVSSALVAPLSSRDGVVAVLVVARTGAAPPYSGVEQELVTAMADRAALVVENALAYAWQRSMSETMQRALLPPVLPHPEHLQLAARYQPAGDAQLVGGDWYDAYLDARGTTSLVIGDVAGHDIEAAATMGQLRTMLRMAGHDGTATAGTVLAAVDAACDTLAHGVFATVLVAQIDGDPATSPGGERSIRWSSAGHPPPLLLHADGRVDVLTDPVGMPLGVLPDQLRPDHLCSLPAGSTLLLYTDGLIEHGAGPAGARDLDQGLERLVGVLTGAAALGLDALCDRVVDTLLPASGADDDVALIAVRVAPPTAGT